MYTEGIKRNGAITGKQDTTFLIKLKASICYMSAFSFLGVCPGKMLVCVFLETHIRMLISALFMMEKNGGNKCANRTICYCLQCWMLYYWERDWNPATCRSIDKSQNIALNEQIWYDGNSKVLLKQKKKLNKISSRDAKRCQTVKKINVAVNTEVKMVVTSKWGGKWMTQGDLKVKAMIYFLLLLIHTLVLLVLL